MSTQPWDASQGTNPDTCWHNIIHVPISGVPRFVCSSCGTVIADRERQDRTYVFNIEDGQWTCKGKPFDLKRVNEHGVTLRAWSKYYAKSVAEGNNYPIRFDRYKGE